jgi:hypothetical protein
MIDAETTNHFNGLPVNRNLQNLPLYHSELFHNKKELVRGANHQSHLWISTQKGIFDPK